MRPGRTGTTLPTRCRSQSWGWTPTTDRNSSTSTCWNGAKAPDHLHTRAGGEQERRLSRRAEDWAVVRTVVGYHRYDTAPELLLLNEIWQLQSKLTNYFYPQQKLISKARDGAKVSKKYDTAATPFQRAINHPDDRGPRRGPGHSPGPDQPRRHAAPDSGLDQPTPHPDLQQSRTANARAAKRALSNEATRSSTRAS